MALVKAVLEQTIKAALVRQASKQSEGDSPEAAINELAADLATAIDTYIKSGTVSTVIVGTSPSGPVSGTGIGTIA